MRNYELRDSILNVSRRLGIDPVDLANAISYETSGTFDPNKVGPKKNGNQYIGLIQMGQYERNKYHVPDNPTIPEEMEGVRQYLLARGVRPGMGLLDIYSAINAGYVGLYDATDEHNGGDHGTVRDKVNQMRADGHHTKALWLMEPGVTDGPKGQETYVLPFKDIPALQPGVPFPGHLIPSPVPRPAQPQDKIGLTGLSDVTQSNPNQQFPPEGSSTVAQKTDRFPVAKPTPQQLSALAAGLRQQAAKLKAMRNDGSEMSPVQP